MSLREVPRALYRAFDEQDTIDVVTRLSLIAILVSDHVAGYEWYIKAPLRSVAVLAILVPPLHRQWWLWAIAAFAFVLRTLTDWWIQDNHLFVFTYWCLTLTAALRLAQPERALATSARLMVGLSFAFATLWKGFLSPDYMDGSYFHFTMLADVRFRDLAYMVGRVPDADIAANLERLVQLGSFRPDVEAVTLESSRYLVIFAHVLTWWTVVIEGLLALTFLWPGPGGPARLRNWVLLLFGATTYTVATVPTFGWTLLTLGAAQCTREERLERFLYALTCVLVLAYSYVKILELAKPFVPPSIVTSRVRSVPLGACLLGGLLLVYTALAMGSARQKSVTVDELGHLPSGVYFLLTADPRHAALNPPLLNALSAVPVLFMDLEQELDPPEPSEDPFSFWANGYHFHEMHRADYRRIFDAARVVPIALVGLLAVLVFVWARRLAPEAPDLAGVLAAGWLCLSPNVIAQARLVGTDAGTALFVGLAIFSLRGMLLRPRARYVLLCGVALGLAQLAKPYALLLYPVSLAVVLLWHRLSPAPRPGVAHLLGAFGGAALVSLLVLNSGYLWREVGTSLAELDIRSDLLAAWQGSLVGSLPLPLPAAYLRGLDGQLVEVGSRIPGFLFGESFEGGRPTFYAALMAVKTPIPLMLAFALALAVAIARLRLPAREVVLLLTYPVALFALLSASSGRQLGIRALLSAAPMVWVFAAASLANSGPRRWPRIAAAACLAGTLAVSLGTYPDYLSYFNGLVGGSEQGYRYASDANVDIGQDLVQLARWLEREDVGRIQLLYFGSVDPALYGIDYEVPEGHVEPGWLAVSVTLYRMAYPLYDHGELRTVGPVAREGLGEPVARIGGSIHVYRVGR